MKQLLLIPLLLVFGSPAMADYRQGGGTQQTTCYETVYREEYIPGTRNNPGRVRRWNERVEVECESHSTYEEHSHSTQTDTDDNSCIEGAIIGGIAGGGAGAALSRGDGRWWAIPLGVVAGTTLGCQIDGG